MGSEKVPVTPACAASGRGGPTHSILAEAAPLYACRLVNLPEHGPNRDRGRIEPASERPDRAGILVAAEHDHDLGACAVLVGLRFLQQQLQAFVRPSQAVHIQRHQLPSTLAKAIHEHVNDPER